MVIAERTTSYGFLAALCGVRPTAIAQQGRTDLWPENSLMLPLKKIIQNYAFSHADLIHAWGPVMTVSMKEAKVEMEKVLVLPKGIRLEEFAFSPPVHYKGVNAIVTRSLMPEYRHNVILEAFAILHREGVDISLTIVGDGTEMPSLKRKAKQLGIADKVIFTGRIPNTALPGLLGQSNIYISMPITEGVSASLFEAMACGCFPVVTDIPGNQSWINHRQNGALVPVDNAAELAAELRWALQHGDICSEAAVNNRRFVEMHADFNTNMSIIANKYHDMITASKSV